MSGGCRSRRGLILLDSNQSIYPDTNDTTARAAASFADDMNCQKQECRHRGNIAGRGGRIEERYEYGRERGRKRHEQRQSHQHAGECVDEHNRNTEHYQIYEWHRDNTEALPQESFDLPEQSGDAAEVEIEPGGEFFKKSVHFLDSLVRVFDRLDRQG